MVLETSQSDILEKFSRNGLLMVRAVPGVDHFVTNKYMAGSGGPTGPESGEVVAVEGVEDGAEVTGANGGHGEETSLNDAAMALEAKLREMDLPGVAARALVKSVEVFPSEAESGSEQAARLRDIMTDIDSLVASVALRVVHAVGQASEHVVRDRMNVGIAKRFGPPISEPNC